MKNSRNNIEALFPCNKASLGPAITKSVKPVYYIDHTVINGEIINIDYTLNDNWLCATLILADLKEFVLTAGLNYYSFDYAVDGEHTPDCGTLQLDTFIDENLNDCVEAYLKTGRVWQNVA